MSNTKLNARQVRVRIAGTDGDSRSMTVRMGEGSETDKALLSILEEFAKEIQEMKGHDNSDETDGLASAVAGGLYEDGVWSADKANQLFTIYTAAGSPELRIDSDGAQGAGYVSILAEAGSAAVKVEDGTDYVRLDTSAANGIDTSMAANIGSNLAVGGTAAVTGAATLSSTLAVTSDISGSAGMKLSGDADLDGGLDVAGATGLQSTLAVQGAAGFISTVYVQSTATFAGAIDADSTSDFQGAMNLQAGITVGGDADLNGNIDVAGTADLAASGVLTNVRGTLSVDEAATLDSALTVAGATDLNGSLDAAGATSLAATGVLTDVRGTLSVDEAATFDSTVAITGAATMASTLGVTGAATLSSTLGVTGAATLSSTLDVAGATGLQSTLAVGGASGFIGDATFVANITGSSNMKLSGNADLDGTLDADGAVNFQSTLGVVGAAGFASTLQVDGAVDANSTSTFADQITLDGVAAANRKIYSSAAMKLEAAGAMDITATGLTIFDHGDATGYDFSTGSERSDWNKYYSGLSVIEAIIEAGKGGMAMSVDIEIGSDVDLSLGVATLDFDSLPAGSTTWKAAESSYTAFVEFSGSTPNYDDFFVYVNGQLQIADKDYDIASATPKKLDFTYQLDSGDTVTVHFKRI